jgi:hypothetical protein
MGISRMKLGVPVWFSSKDLRITGLFLGNAETLVSISHAPFPV